MIEFDAALSTLPEFVVTVVIAYWVFAVNPLNTTFCAPAFDAVLDGVLATGWLTPLAGLCVTLYPSIVREPAALLLVHVNVKLEVVTVEVVAIEGVAGAVYSVVGYRYWYELC